MAELVQLTRRDFLKVFGAAGGALAASRFIPPAVAKAAPRFDQGSDGVIHTMCEMCVWRCGVVAKIKGGRVVKLEGNPEHPHSRGRLCARGQAGLMNTYDPDRVLTPLIREGKRGEGLFRKATWEEALDKVAENMLKIKEQYGPEAMVFSSTHNLSQVQFENLLYGYGSPNYGTQRSLCFNAMIVASIRSMAVMTPRPAQPTPGSGPPDSTQRMPPKPACRARECASSKTAGSGTPGRTRRATRS